MDRRTLLQRAALVGAVGLAGCSSGGEDGETTDAPATTTDPTEAMDGSTTTDPTNDGPATTEASATTETSDAPPTATAEPTESEPQESVTVTVGDDGAARYSPDSFTLVQGGEVTWEYAMGGHNVIPESTPDGASFEGSPGGDSETQDAGFSFSETFDTAGEYAYYCSVHRSIGMEGSFTVE